jgi:hypothetical protein
MAYHFYAVNTNHFVHQLLEVRAFMKRKGLDNLPLSNTETGIEFPPLDQPLPTGAQPWSGSEAACVVAQLRVLGAASGVDRYYYYASDNERSWMFSLPRVGQPAWDGYERVQSWLLRATLRGCVAMPPNGVRCQGERGDQRFLIVWAEKAGMYNIPVPVPVKIRVVSIHKLLASSSKSISVRDHSPKLILGSEPVQIMLGPSQP